VQADEVDEVEADDEVVYLLHDVTLLAVNYLKIL
jgi:hypothetical protein